MTEQIPKHEVNLRDCQKHEATWKGKQIKTANSSSAKRKSENKRKETIKKNQAVMKNCKNYKNKSMTVYNE